MVQSYGRVMEPLPWIMVKENPGITNTDLSLLTAVGNNLFFRANDGIHGIELWKVTG